MNQNQKPSFLAYGSRRVGLMMMTSSEGKSPLQKVFLQSSCLRVLVCSTTKLTKNLRESDFKTGANLLNLDETTTWDLACGGRRMTSFFVVETHTDIDDVAFRATLFLDCTLFTKG